MTGSREDHLVAQHSRLVVSLIFLAVVGGGDGSGSALGHVSLARRKKEQLYVAASPLL